LPEKHQFTSAVADGADATLVQPGDWNDIHVTPYATGSFTIPTGNGAYQVKRMTLTSTQRATLAGTARLRID
jgi:hypothetical protein